MRMRDGAISGIGFYPHWPILPPPPPSSSRRDYSTRQNINAGKCQHKKLRKPQQLPTTHTFSDVIFQCMTISFGIEPATFTSSLCANLPHNTCATNGTMFSGLKRIITVFIVATRFRDFIIFRVYSRVWSSITMSLSRNLKSVACSPRGYFHKQGYKEIFYFILWQNLSTTIIYIYIYI